MTETTTRDRIVDAAIALVSERGYKGATTKLIAEHAGVNEVTLFRHFGSKKGIVEAAVDKFAFDDQFFELFDAIIQFDLEKDLQMLVREQQKNLERKREIILVSFKEAGAFPELDKMIAHIPETYKLKLADYFKIMIEKDKIKEQDPFVIAENFIFLNFGYFLLKDRINTTGSSLDLDTFLANNVKVFIRSLV